MAKKQGFDILSKDIAITVERNWKIPRKTTWMPDWSDLVHAFGMPGDSQRFDGLGDNKNNIQFACRILLTGA